MSMNDNDTRQDDDMPQAHARERKEPIEKPNPIPRVFMVMAVLIIAWGLSYFYMRTGSITGAGDMRTPIVQKAGGSAGSVDGSAIFASNCASCHQSSGKGLPGVFPPLDGSGWVTAKAKVPVQILLHGINGKIKVKGTTYQSVMPAFGSSLSNAEIAAVLTYIRQAWSNTAAPISAEFVAKQRKATAQRGKPWGGGAEIREVVGEPQR